MLLQHCRAEGNETEGRFREAGSGSCYRQHVQHRSQGTGTIQERPNGKQAGQEELDGLMGEAQILPALMSSVYLCLPSLLTQRPARNDWCGRKYGRDGKS